MKTLFIILLSLVTFTSGFTNQEGTTVKAVFDGFDDGTYYFTDSNDEDEAYTFDKIEEDVLESYDLTDTKYKGEIFNITFKIETETNEFEDEYFIWIIVKLELIN